MTDPTNPSTSQSTWEASPLIQDDDRAREVRARRGGARLVPFEGCPLFSSDEIGELPESLNLRVRLGIYCDGDEIWFTRRPFPTSITTAEIQRRWGPPPPTGKYIVQLWDVNPSVPGSGLKTKVSKVKHVAITARDPADVGEEPWIIDLNSPELPSAVRAEVERRKAYWPDPEADAQAAAAAQAAAQGGTAQMYDQMTQGTGTTMAQGTATAQGHGPPCASPPGHHWTWAQGVGWALATDAAPAQNGLGSLFAGKSIEEIATSAAMLAKLWKELSGGGAGVSAETERLRQENETRRMQMQQEHELRMAQFARAQQPTVVDADAIRAKIMVEIQGRELERLKTQKSHSSGLGDIMDKLAEAKKVAAAFGMKPGGDASEPSTIDQFLDGLSTPAGKSAVEMILSKVLNVPPPPASPELPPGPSEGDPSGG